MNDLELCTRRVGSTLKGKWTLEKVIGVGGMAAVYAAHHKIGRRDAIKILHKDIAALPVVRARFEQEAHAVNQFKHPGAVEIRDIDVSDEGEPFLVMELLEGQPLSRVLREGSYDTVQVLRWADELLDVLAAAHAQGIVHRDIKPDNLFITDAGRLKVLDFGIARVRSGASSVMKTRTGATIGTVSYMSPEQAKGGDIDGRADIFSVGATMFRLIAKKKIHEAENDVELLKKMATEPAPSLATVAPATPESVTRIVDRALRFGRDDRYADAAAMQRDVRAAIAELTGAPSDRAVSPAAESVGALALRPAALPMPMPPPTVSMQPNAPAPPVAPTVDDPRSIVPTSHAPDAPTRVDETKLAAGQSPPPSGQPASMASPMASSEPRPAVAPRVTANVIVLAAIGLTVLIGLIAVVVIAGFVAAHNARMADGGPPSDVEAASPDETASAPRSAEPLNLPPPPKPGQSPAPKPPASSPHLHPHH